MINPMDLTGKKYLVTGASSGLGRQVCITLSQLGATVYMVARRVENLEATKTMLEGDGHQSYPFDLSKVEEIESLIKQIVEENGALDGLVHCAGVAGIRPLGYTTYEFIKENMNINTFSFMELVRTIYRKKKNYVENGSVVVVSSIASMFGDKAKTAYCASKGAIDAAVRALAAELGEQKNVRVNTVNPAWIKTKMYYGYLELHPEVTEEEIATDYILGIAEPIEVANVIAFLLSPAASKITGQNIVVDGGYSIKG